MSFSFNLPFKDKDFRNPFTETYQWPLKKKHVSHVQQNALDCVFFFMEKPVMSDWRWYRSSCADG